MSRLTCQCDAVVFEPVPCQALATQEDLLCDACRLSRAPEHSHVIVVYDDRRSEHLCANKITIR